MGKLEILAQINVLNQRRFNVEKEIEKMEEEFTKYTAMKKQMLNH